jgi:hypothetical protein
MGTVENHQKTRFEKIEKIRIDFRFNTPTPFPESGSRKRLHASEMRGIDFSHNITPRNVFFTKIFKKIFSENGLRLLSIFKGHFLERSKIGPIRGDKVGKFEPDPDLYIFGEYGVYKKTEF